MKKFFLGLFSFVILSLGMSQALVLEFVNLNLEGLLERLAETQFVAPGNNFGGAIFWLPAKSLFTPEGIELNGETKHCRKLARGLYYNSQRGERLRPMDPYSLETMRDANPSYDDLMMSGGFYTVCDENTYGIFGQISYNRSGTETFVTAGTKLDYLGNWLTGEFADSFEYFNNLFPLGYIVDNVGGIGFVGGILTGHDCLTCFLNGNCSDPSCGNYGCSGDSISELFTYSGEQIFPAENCEDDFTFSGDSGGITGEIGDIQRGITIQGNVGLSQSLDQQDRQALLGNYNEKIAVVNVPQVNISTLVNQAKKNAQSLCRGRKNYAGDPVSVPTGLDDEVICVLFDNYSPSNDMIINLADSNDKNKYLGKTLVVQNGDLYLRHSMSAADAPFDLFVDNGNLYLDWEMPTYLQEFGNNGFPVSSGAVTSGLYLKGNLIVNGLILGNTGVDTDFEVEHKLYVHGKMNSLNTPIEPSEGRISQVETLFGGVNIYDSGINLQRVFTRYCNPITGVGSDGVWCFDDQFADSPLVIIGQDYETKLY